MRDSLRKPVINSDDKSKMICFNCNKPGHLRSQCTQKSIERSREVNLALGVRNEVLNKAERVIVAQKARRTKQQELTHNVLNSTTINGSQQLLRVKGQIDGKSVDCVVDTGATMSVMSDRIRRRFNFDTDTRVVQIKLANGQMTSGKCTLPLPVDIQGKCSNIEFVILPQEGNIEVIIGLDWLVEHGAVIHSKEGVLQFPDQLEKGDLREIEEQILLTEVDEDDLQEETDWTDAKFEFDLPIHLADYQKEEFRKFLEANRERFATTLFDLGTCNVKKFDIITSSEKPIYQHPYRKSEKEKQAIRLELERMLQAKIIEPSTSPWSSLV